MCKTPNSGISLIVRKNSKNRTFKQFYGSLAYSFRGHRNRCTSQFRVRKKYVFEPVKLRGIMKWKHG